MADDERESLLLLKPFLERRAAIIREIREFFNGRGFFEVDTPIRVPSLAPEAYITPLTSEGWYLITSPELHMKRLLSAGYEKIFQICHCFRKGERGRWHNPEFTMLEWYRARADYIKMIDDTTELLDFLVQKMGMTKQFIYRGKKVDISSPWYRITVSEAFKKYCGWDPIETPDALKFDLDLVEKVIPSLPEDRPVVLVDYPAPMASLSRLKSSDLRVAERAEVFICGLEIANAFSELNDVTEQERRFRKEIELIKNKQGRTMDMPVKFLESLKNMPEAGGIALGVDRLVMLFCDTDRIDQVLPFTVDTA